MGISNGFKEYVMNILNMKIYVPGKTLLGNLILGVVGPSHIIYFQGAKCFCHFKFKMDTIDNRLQRWDVYSQFPK